MGKISSALSKSFVVLIKGYQYFISPLLGNACRFYPSCSSYARQSIQHHGWLRGLFFSLKRILRCHPWSAGGYDPVPEYHSKC